MSCSTKCSQVWWSKIVQCNKLVKKIMNSAAEAAEFQKMLLPVLATKYEDCRGLKQNAIAYNCITSCYWKRTTCRDTLKTLSDPVGPTEIPGSKNASKRHHLSCQTVQTWGKLRHTHRRKTRTCQRLNTLHSTSAHPNVCGTIIVPLKYWNTDAVARSRKHYVYGASTTQQYTRI